MAHVDILRHFLLFGTGKFLMLFAEETSKTSYHLSSPRQQSVDNLLTLESYVLEGIAR